MDVDVSLNLEIDIDIGYIDIDVDICIDIDIDIGYRYGCSTMYAALPSSQAFGVGGQSYSNFPASSALMFLLV